MERNKNFKLRIIVILVLTFHISLLTFHNCYAGPGVTSATFLKIGIGARPSAMGEAYTAISDDVTAIYWNPAGLSNVTDKELSFIHTEWFQSIRHSHIGYCQPAFGGTIGVGSTILWIDGIERRASDTLNADGYVVSRDISASIAYARPISQMLGLGATLKILYCQLDDRTSAGAAFDLGLFLNMKDDVRAGLSIQNLGYQSPYITEQNLLPINIKAGLSKKFDSNFTFASDVNYCLFDNIFIAGAGVEYWLHPIFAIRGGYKYNTASTQSLGFLSGLTCGVGFNVNNIAIDYAFVPYGDLGFTHRVSMIARL